MMSSNEIESSVASQILHTQLRGCQWCVSCQIGKHHQKHTHIYKCTLEWLGETKQRNLLPKNILKYYKSVLACMWHLKSWKFSKLNHHYIHKWILFKQVIFQGSDLRICQQILKSATFVVLMFFLLDVRGIGDNFLALQIIVVGCRCCQGMCTGRSYVRKNAADVHVALATLSNTLNRSYFSVKKCKSVRWVIFSAALADILRLFQLILHY